MYDLYGKSSCILAKQFISDKSSLIKTDHLYMYGGSWYSTGGLLFVPVSSNPFACFARFESSTVIVSPCTIYNERRVYGVLLTIFHITWNLGLVGEHYTLLLQF